MSKFFFFLLYFILKDAKINLKIGEKNIYEKEIF